MAPPGTGGYHARRVSHTWRRMRERRDDKRGAPMKVADGRTPARRKHLRRYVSELEDYLADAERRLERICSILGGVLAYVDAPSQQKLDELRQLVGHAGEGALQVVDPPSQVVNRGAVDGRRHPPGE